MRKLMLFALAAFVLTSCDNAAKKKNKSDSESEETARLKKPLKEEETSEEDSRTVTHQNADAKAGTKTESTSYASGWPSTEKNMFMSTCVDKAKAGMGETQAKNYCSCMLEKIEEMYPNATDATKLDQEKMTTLAKECLGQ